MKSELDNTGIKSEILAEATTSWDGKPLPSYPTSGPLVSIIKYVFPPHCVTNSHLHKVINCGVVLKGVLTIVSSNGLSRDFHAGEAIVETVGEIHHGENRGDSDVEIIMFYAGDKTTPLSTPAE